MRTSIHHAVEAAILRPAEDNRSAADPGRKVVIRVRDLAFVREVHPITLEDVLHLEVKELTIGEDIPAATKDSRIGIVDYRGLDPVAQVNTHCSNPLAQF